MTTCRYCSAPVTLEFADLGKTPLANSYLPKNEEAIANERSWPLKVMVCEACWLVQTTETVSADAIFDHDYAYLSSFSQSWLDHAERYAKMMAERFALTTKSKVVEVASNDGYLLQYFVRAGIPVLGVEPAGHAAEIAEDKGVPTRVAFFGAETARGLVEEGHQADVLAANNVLAHVPDIRDFVAGFAILLKSDGVITFEFPHLVNLIAQSQFDTIYHEHYSYLSLHFVSRLLKDAGLEVFDIEELGTHGGSLRVFAGHLDAHVITPAVEKTLGQEREMKLNSADGYYAFGRQVEVLCDGLLNFLKQAKADGKRVAAYGAPAKGNTFLNVAGITSELIDFTVDRNPEKQDTLLPGSHIPVMDPSHILETKPDYLIILPWNLSAEITRDHGYIRDWGGQFVTAVPKLVIQ